MKKNILVLLWGLFPYVVIIGGAVWFAVDRESLFATLYNDTSILVIKVVSVGFLISSILLSVFSVIMRYSLGVISNKQFVQVMLLACISILVSLFGWFFIIPGVEDIITGKSW